MKNGKDTEEQLRIKNEELRIKTRQKIQDNLIHLLLLNYNIPSP